MSEKLLQTILDHTTVKDSHLHGSVHWASVAAAGLTLLENTPEADADVMLLFAMLHDSMRKNNGYDPEHGARAAALAYKLHGAGTLELEEERLATLEEALISHDKGRTTTDPTIGTCWDADRLTLWRGGREPDPALLSTATAKDPRVRAASVYYPHIAFNWQAIFLNYKNCRAGPNREDPLYLRFGDLPEDGRSLIVPFLGFREVAASVYRGRRIEDASYCIDLRQLLMGVESRQLRLFLYQERPLFVVRGREVGFGGTGEPILVDAQVIEEVSPNALEVLPRLPKSEAALTWWRAKMSGEDPGPPSCDTKGVPEDRPLFPVCGVSGGTGFSSFREAVTAAAEVYLEEWGMLEDYHRMQAQRRRKKQDVTKKQKGWTYWNT